MELQVELEFEMWYLIALGTFIIENSQTTLQTTQMKNMLKICHNCKRIPNKENIRYIPARFVSTAPQRELTIDIIFK